MTIEELLNMEVSEPDEELMPMVLVCKVSDALKIDLFRIGMVANMFKKEIEDENILAIEEFQRWVNEFITANKDQDDKAERNRILMSLYFLSRLGLPIDDLKEKYNYNEEEAKKLVIDL